MMKKEVDVDNHDTEENDEIDVDVVDDNEDTDEVDVDVDVVDDNEDADTVGWPGTPI